MRRNDKMQAIGDVLVSYSAEQMPTDVIERVHEQVRQQYVDGERNLRSTFQIFDLLLNISLAKLKAVA